MYSSTVILPAEQSSRRAIAWYFRFLKPASLIWLAFHSGGVAFVINWYRFITSDFCLVVFCGSKLPAVSGFALCNSITVVGIVIALYNEVFSTTLALHWLPAFCELQFQNICYSSKLILDIQKMQDCELRSAFQQVYPSSRPERRDRMTVWVSSYFY